VFCKYLYDLKTTRYIIFIRLAPNFFIVLVRLLSTTIIRPVNYPTSMTLFRVTLGQKCSFFPFVTLPLMNFVFVNYDKRYQRLQILVAIGYLCSKARKHCGNKLEKPILKFFIYVISL